jgi:hypothetical protein
MPTMTVDSDFTVDTNTLHVDAINNRVGIGTNSPSTKLHVQSDVYATGKVSLGELYFDPNPMLELSTDNLSSSYIKSLDSTALNITAGQIFLNHGDFNSVLETYPTGVGVIGSLNADSASISGNLTVDTNTLHVDAVNSKVGIGTDDPYETLTVNGHALTFGEYHHWFEQVKYWNRQPGAGSYDANESTSMVSTANHRVPPGNSGMIPIATINTRAFQNYVCVKTNWTIDNLMFQLRYQGYMYGYGIADAHAGGYTYTGNNVISKSQYETGSGNQFIADTYRTSEGHLCIKIFLGHTNYTEGVGTLWFGGHGDSWRDIQVLDVRIRNDGANHPF